MTIFKAITFTIIGGLLSDMFIFSFMNWPGGGSIIAIAIMGGCILKELKKNTPPD